MSTIKGYLVLVKVHDCRRTRLSDSSLLFVHFEVFIIIKRLTLL